MTTFFDFDALARFLTAACDHYERSAPTVSAYADDLYRRCHEEPEQVRLAEITAIAALHAEDEWEHPNYAANRIYHLLHRLGMDLTGQAGF